VPNEAPRSRSSSPLAAAPAWLLAHFAGYVVLLGHAVKLFPPNAELPNAAARAGYNTEVAFVFAAAWTVLGVLGFFLLRARGAGPELARPPVEDAPASPPVPRRRAAVELLLIAAAVTLLYFPPFLSRHGHYLEDNYFLYVLSRMECGELPYRDFEFLYGPLMIYPAHYFVRLLGFSMTSYFAFIALLEAAFYAGLMRVLQHFVPQASRRYVALALLAPFFFNSLLGPNYSGFRQGFVLFALLLVSQREASPRAALGAGLLCGVELAYSYEYGLMGLCAGLGVYASSLLGRDRARPFQLGALLVAGAGLGWLLITLALTRGTFTDYLTSTLAVLRQASASGLGRFRFYWTLNSLSFFALLTLCTAAIGSGLFRFSSQAATAGDRLLLAGFLFAVGTLKVGLQRADVWHLTPPFLLVVFAVVIEAPRRAFALDGPPWMRRGLVGVAGVTRLIGMHVTIGMVLGGLLHGADDSLRGRPRGASTSTRGYSIESELSWPHSDYLEVAKYLADGSRAQRPVLFYGDRWWLAYHAGVCPVGYSFYVLLYSDELKPIAAELLRRPDTLIVLSKDAYELTFSGKPLRLGSGKLPLPLELASWLGSVHFSQSQAERVIKYELWQRRFGDLLRRRYRLAASFGDQVVLEQL